MHCHEDMAFTKVFSVQFETDMLVIIMDSNVQYSPRINLFCFVYMFIFVFQLLTKSLLSTERET